MIKVLIVEDSQAMIFRHEARLREEFAGSGILLESHLIDTPDWEKLRDDLVAKVQEQQWDFLIFDIDYRQVAASDDYAYSYGGIILYNMVVNKLGKKFWRHELIVSKFGGRVTYDTKEPVLVAIKVFIHTARIPPASVLSSKADSQGLIRRIRELL